MSEDKALAQIYNAINNDSASADFETARANVIAMIDEGKASLAVLAQVADQSQNPRAYEVLAKLIDTLLDANRQLLELQTKIRTIQQADTGVTGNQTINNNLYLTTTDLHKLLKEKRDNE